MRVADNVTLDALADLDLDQTVLLVQDLLTAQHDFPNDPLWQFSAILEHLDHPLDEFLGRPVPLGLAIVFWHRSGVGIIHWNRI